MSFWVKTKSNFLSPDKHDSWDLHTAFSLRTVIKNGASVWFDRGQSHRIRPDFLLMTLDLFCKILSRLTVPTLIFCLVLPMVLFCSYPSSLYSKATLGSRKCFPIPLLFEAFVNPILRGRISKDFWVARPEFSPPRTKKFGHSWRYSRPPFFHLSCNFPPAPFNKADDRC